MDKERIFGYIEMAGELIVVAAAAVWMPLREVAPLAFAFGVAVFAIGRFLQTPYYAKLMPTDVRELPLRRLHHQRVFGMVALILSAVPWARRRWPTSATPPADISSLQATPRR